MSRECGYTYCCIVSGYIQWLVVRLNVTANGKSYGLFYLFIFYLFFYSL